jgi:signal transduction histidine kinase
VLDILLASQAKLRTRWQMAAQIAWAILVTFDLITFVAAVPAYAAQLSTICRDATKITCTYTQLTAADIETLLQAGISFQAYIAYTLAIHVAVSLVCFAVGLLIAWRKSGDWYGLCVSFVLVTLGANGSSGVLNSALGSAYPQLRPLVYTVGWMIFPALGLFLTTFPDGRFVPRWSWIVPLMWLVQALMWGAIEHLPGPLAVAEVLTVYGSTLVVQIYRYRRASNAAQRQQTKWVVFGFALAISTLLLQLVLSITIPQFDAFDGILESTWLALVLIQMPITIGIAILRYRLWDIDIIISRALVYAIVTAFVIGAYIFVVAYVGALFRIEGTLAPSLVATGLVAVLFQPLREHVQRGINRLMFGDRDDPYALLSRLGQRLEATLASDAALPTIVQTIKDALKLPYVAIALKADQTFSVVASAGEPRSNPVRWLLSYQQKTVGELLLAPRAGDDAFGRADRHLVDDLARQVGVVAHAVRLTHDLQRANADLQASRQRLITLREEERLRIRRDLHDDLAPTLAGLALTAGTIGPLIATNPTRAAAVANDLQTAIRDSVGSIRRLVYDLRPSALDELGLLGAIRERAAQYSISHRGAGELQIVVEAPDRLPTLPAAVEVAAYKIVQEALMNVVKHAHARHCSIQLTVADTLMLHIADDGVGLPDVHSNGVGLRSIQERATELGGTCVIERGGAGGTHIAVSIPLGKEAAHE